MSVYEDLNSLSLLWPVKNDANIIVEDKLSEMSMFDLGVDELVQALSINNRYNKFIKSVLAQLCDDTATLQYRFDVVEDLLRCPSLADTFEMLLPMFSELDGVKSTGWADQSQLLLTVRRLGELEIYAKCIAQISLAIQEAGEGIKSEALSRLREMLKAVTEEEQFKSLLSNLPELRSGFESLASVTIGINLDVQLRPVEATILSINNKKFREEAFIDRLFNKKQTKSEYVGMSKLHSIVEPDVQTEIGKTKKLYKDNLSQALQITLFNDLHRILNRVVEPVSAAIAKFTKMNSAFLSDMEPELGFYLSIIKLIKTIRSCGLEMCRPDIVPIEDRILNVEENFNIQLALRRISKGYSKDLQDKVITNNVTMGNHGRIFILTGPNQGGKTTYIQAIGVTQVMMQAGIFVPGRSARMSPADNIITHFPVEEKPSADAGRLGEESKRLGEIFRKATEYSLVILNESLASTSPGESLYMSEDIVRGLRLLGSRAIFATHLHDLATRAKAINEEIPGDSLVISMVAGAIKEKDGLAGTARRTYKVIPSPPQGTSFARDIASRYGISFDQITITLKDRNLKSLRADKWNKASEL